jgi:hypothetical protein
MLPIYLIPVGDKEMFASVFLIDVKASVRERVLLEDSSIFG